MISLERPAIFFFPSRVCGSWRKLEVVVISVASAAGEQELSRGSGPAALASSPALGPSTMPGASAPPPPPPPGPWPAFVCAPLPPPHATLATTSPGPRCAGSFFSFSFWRKTLEGSGCHLTAHHLLDKEPKCGNELAFFRFIYRFIFNQRRVFFCVCVFF